MELTEAEWDRVMGVKLKGPVYCLKAVIPGMVDQGHGVIVNIASVAATTRGSASDWARASTSVSPGTRMTGGTYADNSS